MGAPAISYGIRHHRGRRLRCGDGFATATDAGRQNTSLARERQHSLKKTTGTMGNIADPSPEAPDKLNAVVYLLRILATN